ncbi:Rhodanese-like protein [Hypoxylon sp. NC0597]|nr:Rhodanese-like protein [Hypoxylon sp. NC0597]
MATGRLAISTAGLRGVSSRAMSSAAPCLLRASFGTTSRAPRAPAMASRLTAIARPQLSRLIAPATIRWSSDSAPASKIWSFEEINKAISPDSPGSTPKVTIIDTREPSELSQTGRIPGALNIPIVSAPDSFHISADEFRDKYGFERPDPEEDGEIVFYCKAGVRSRAAAEIAKQAGYKNVGEYPGSWLDWVEKGGKVER